MYVIGKIKPKLLIIVVYTLGIKHGRLHALVEKKTKKSQCEQIKNNTYSLLG